MADESSTGIVAVLVIFVMVVVGGLFAYRSGMVGTEDTNIDVKIEAPAKEAPAKENPVKESPAKDTDR